MFPGQDQHGWPRGAGNLVVHSVIVELPNACACCQRALQKQNSFFGQLLERMFFTISP